MRVRRHEHAAPPSFFAREGPDKPVDCGYPSIIGRTANGARVALNASAAIAPDDDASLERTQPRDPAASSGHRR